MHAHTCIYTYITLYHASTYRYTYHILPCNTHAPHTYIPLPTLPSPAVQLLGLPTASLLYPHHIIWKALLHNQYLPPSVLLRVCHMMLVLVVVVVGKGIFMCMYQAFSHVINIIISHLKFVRLSIILMSSIYIMKTNSFISDVIHIFNLVYI